MVYGLSFCLNRPPKVNCFFWGKGGYGNSIQIRLSTTSNWTVE